MTASREAVEKIRKNLSQFDTVSEISATAKILEEMMRLSRKGAWELMPDRCATVRTSLIAIRSGNPDFPSQLQKWLQSAVTQFKSIENQIESVVAGEDLPPAVPLFNARISEMKDHLNEILFHAKAKIGR